MQATLRARSCRDASPHGGRRCASLLHDIRRTSPHYCELDSTLDAVNMCVCAGDYHSRPCMAVCMASSHTSIRHTAAPLLPTRTIRSFKQEAAAISFVQALSAAARAKVPDAGPLPMDAASTDAEAPPPPEGPMQGALGGGASSTSNGGDPSEGGSKGRGKASGKYYAVSVGRTVGLPGGQGAHAHTMRSCGTCAPAAWVLYAVTACCMPECALPFGKGVLGSRP